MEFSPFGSTGHGRASGVLGVVNLGLRTKKRPAHRFERAMRRPIGSGDAQTCFARIAKERVLIAP
jgi:hypothetical protein